MKGFPQKGHTSHFLLKCKELVRDTYYEGPAEIFALLRRKIPVSQVKKVLEITLLRQQNKENEQTRYFNAFKLTKYLHHISPILVLIVVLCFLGFLYKIGNGDAAEKILSVLLPALCAVFGGWGWAQKNK